ncbi:DUF829-domain-containing protein [Daldinia loculata]|uniref:DUF829-domain-containing protein n=1 Tax=Daldinia loculata TaxID=103429 RepID=UPI0020C21553|nr:DUF829-domain-containing protein [Daldinia loculata]KAI1643030.1 DUF829-domain-containing protein [Daldinia loculata]
MAGKQKGLPGFTPISDRIFIRNEDSSETTEKTPSDHPTTIIIYGWGDGHPKNVAKYVDGYNKLFPGARILMVISSTFAATYQSLDQRTKDMMPVVDTVFPTPDDDSARIILHIMSNTGGIYAAATLNAYQERHGKDKALPHHLCINDSTPGSLDFAKEVGRWSKAMAVGTAKWFPWPFTVTQRIWWAFLYTMYLVEKVIGREPSGIYSCRVFLDHSIATPKAPRAYLYSKNDDIIWWEDVEAQAEVAKNRGYKTTLEMFDDSPHVGHMRVHPSRYWSTIENHWKSTIALEATLIIPSSL